MATDEQSIPQEKKDGHLKVEIRDVRPVPLPDGDAGEGLALCTDPGGSNRHSAPRPGVPEGGSLGLRRPGWFRRAGAGPVCSTGPIPDRQGISSLRLDYRQPNLLAECAMDLLAGVTYFEDLAHDPVVVVGHSFGGAVVIAAGAVSRHVAGVVSLSPKPTAPTWPGWWRPAPCW